MMLTAVLLAVAGHAHAAPPTKEDFFKLIHDDQMSIAASIFQSDAEPDTTMMIKNIESYRCKAANAGRYRCTVRYRSLLNRRITLRLLTEKSDTFWVSVDSQKH